MVRIRLRRMGKRHQPSYRVVVADSESPRDGRFIENIGFYNPRNEPPTIEIDAERARYWLSVGAQPSDPAARLLRKIGVLGGAVPAEAALEKAAVEEAAVEEAEVAEAAPAEAEVEEAAVEEAAVEEAEVAEAAPAEAEVEGAATEAVETETVEAEEAEAPAESAETEEAAE
jgi:small subunit ribosomal protein S16